MGQIGIRIIKAIKKGRKITIEFESDLYSNEVFAVTPFYDEGDDKNQLQEVKFVVYVTEEDGVISASVKFGNCLYHYTKGHTQLHKDLTKFYKSKKECALDWVETESEENFNESSKTQILKLWEHDVKFYDMLKKKIKEREQKILENRLAQAKENLIAAAIEYERVANTKVL